MLTKPFLKKAQVETQFHWVFVLIAGAIILAFFVSLTLWYKMQQETKLEGVLVTRLQALFSTSQESPRTAKPLQLPDYRLAFTCDPSACTDYSCASEFSSGGISQPTETDVVFTSHLLSGTQLVTWALPWEVPFPIMNFLYLTNDRQRFVLVYDDHDIAGKTLALAVNELLQQNAYLNKQLVAFTEITSLENYHDDHVRIVFFGSHPEGLTTLLAALYEDDAYDLVIVAGDTTTGTASFSSLSVPYFGTALLLGALFSDDASFYTCNLHKALFRFDLMLNHYQHMLTLYHDELLPTDHAYCLSLVDSMAAHFDTLLIVKNTLVSGSDLSSAASALSALAETNRQLLIQDCPRLY